MNPAPHRLLTGLIFAMGLAVIAVVLAVRIGVTADLMHTTASVVTVSASDTGDVPAGTDAAIRGRADEMARAAYAVAQQDLVARLAYDVRTAAQWLVADVVVLMLLLAWLARTAWRQARALAQ